MPRKDARARIEMWKPFFFVKNESAVKNAICHITLFSYEWAVCVLNYQEINEMCVSRSVPVRMVRCNSSFMLQLVKKTFTLNLDSCWFNAQHWRKELISVKLRCSMPRAQNRCTANLNEINDGKKWFLGCQVLRKKLNVRKHEIQLLWLTNYFRTKNGWTFSSFWLGKTQ